jgi:hypothetical protein
VTSDEEIAETREYFSKTFDGNKVIPILDDYEKLRSALKDLFALQPFVTGVDGFEVCAYCDCGDGHYDECVWTRAKKAAG